MYHKGHQLTSLKEEGVLEVPHSPTETRDLNQDRTKSYTLKGKRLLTEPARPN